MIMLDTVYAFITIFGSNHHHISLVYFESNPTFSRKNSRASRVDFCALVCCDIPIGDVGKDVSDRFNFQDKSKGKDVIE